MREKKLQTSNPIAIVSSAVRTNAWTRGIDVPRPRRLARAVTSALSMNRVRVVCRDVRNKNITRATFEKIDVSGEAKKAIASGGIHNSSTY